MNMLSPLGNEILRFSRHLQHFPGSTIHLPGHEKGNELLGNLPKIDVAPHQKILMTAIGVAQGVGVVLEDIDFPRQALFA